MPISHDIASALSYEIRRARPGFTAKWFASMYSR